VVPARRPRSYVVALGLLALAAALLLLAAGRVWATLVVVEPGLPSITVVVTGSELTYGQPLALLALAGIAGLVALRRVGRVLAGIVLVLCSAAALVSVLVFGATHSSATGAGGWVAAIAAERAGVGVDASGAVVGAWWVVELVGVLLVAAAGVLAVVASREWPSLGRRYERQDAESGTGGTQRSQERSAWEQLDAGVDPTVDPTAEPAAAADEADVGGTPDRRVPPT
jgi:uncharacterized membrane protein (TIGR02234 family)